MNQTLQRQLFSGAGLLLLAVLLLAVVTLGNQLLRGLRVDLTENDLYTLSDGTRSLLGKIEEPVNLYFFFSREAARQFPAISAYGQRVQDFLEELAAVADGKLRLTVIDPEPFSDEEDRAVQLGIQPVPVTDGGENLYFGVAGTNVVDDKEAIPFLQANREELLEYDLAKLIHQLSRVRKPVVGLLSTLSLEGGFDPARMQRTAPWFALEQLRRFFEVQTLETDLRRIPEEVQLLLLIHPADLPAHTLYAVDQFVVGGGNALVFVDTLAESAAAPGRPGGVAQASNPQALLEAWGLRLRAEEVLADRSHALRVAGASGEPAQSHYALVSLTRDNVNGEDVITRELSRLNLAFSGILEPLPDSGLEVTTLVSSSRDAQPVSSFSAQGLDNARQLLRNFQPSGEPYALAVRVRGKIRSAFPEGAPAAAADDGADSEAADAPAPHRDESQQPVNLVVVADTDMLADQMWVRTQRLLGNEFATPWADNGDFLVSAVDNLLGSDDLISLRSRAGYTRPFETVERLKREAESQFLSKAVELEERLRETERQLAELQREKGDAGSLLLSPEQQAAIERFRADQIEIRKQLREVRHRLDREIEDLGGWLKFVNIALVPLLLTVAVVLYGVSRRSAAGQGRRPEARA